MSHKNKLGSIYDALDHGNYKNVLKLCAALLKKEPSHALCKALNAVALERCGRSEEALRLCEEVRATATGADDCWCTLQVVYRRCRQYGKITEMYEAALSAEADHKDATKKYEEYAAALFAAAVREGDYSRSQQVSQKLYHKLKRPEHLLWIVVAILLQVQGGGDTKKLPTLAEMMLQKAPVSCEAPAPGEDGPGPAKARGQQYSLLLLHLATLRLQRKYAEALELLEACKAHVPLPVDLVRMRLRLLVEAGKLREAASEARALVLLDTESWQDAQEYVRLAFRSRATLDAPPPKLLLEQELPEAASLEELEGRRKDGDDEVYNALLLFRHLQREGSARRVVAPHLAELELRRMAICEDEALSAAAAGDADGAVAGGGAGWRAALSANDDWADFVRHVGAYLSRFGGRSSCYLELRPFLCLVEAADVEPSLGELEARAEAGAEGAYATLTCARVRHGLRRPPPPCGGAAAGDGGSSSAGGGPSGEEGGPPEEEEAKAATAAEAEAAAEVSGVLTCWAALRGSAGPAAASGDDGGGGGGRAPAALDELLALSVVTLVDMDRARCRRCLEKRRCRRALRAGDRAHLLDAIALAELGNATMPQLFHFKVLLTLLYAALGLPSAVMRLYGTLDIKNIQHESLSYLALDALCALGSPESTAEVCRQIITFHEDLDKDSTDALSTVFQNGVLQRVPEYIEALDKAARSVLWGRAVVEEVFCELAQAQTYEALVEVASRQGGALPATVAGRPADRWVVGNQDRGMLQCLHPLPRCTPRSLAALSSRAAAPTAPAWSARPRAVNLAAAIWAGGGEEALPGDEGAGPGAAGPRPRQPCELSAVEELLARGRDSSPVRLRCSASLLQALCALLRRDEDALAAAITAARAALGSGAGGEALEDAEAHYSGGFSSPWYSVPEHVSALPRRCALAACEAAQAALRCAGEEKGGGEAWDLVEQRLSSVTDMVKRCVGSIREPDGGGGGGSWPFALGRRGAPALWEFLDGCASVVIPIILWCATNFPKGGSGKKAKAGGQESLHTARGALRSLLASLQHALTELQGDLSSPREEEPAGEGLPPPAEVPALAKLPDFPRFRKQVDATLLEAHQRHLQSLREATAARLALLKTKASFRP